MERLDKRTRNVMLNVIIIFMSILFWKSHGTEENIIPYISHWKQL